MTELETVNSEPKAIEPISGGVSIDPPLLFMAVPMESGRLSFVRGYVSVDGATTFETEAAWQTAMAEDAEAHRLAPPPVGPKMIPGGAFFDRLTEGEADTVDQAMQKRSVKFRGAWNAIVNGGDLRSDADIWNVLRDELVTLFGEPRADVLLA